jgi:hypothetical protein
MYTNPYSVAMSRDRGSALATLAALCAAASAAADDWRQMASVPVVEVRVHWSTPRELEEIARGAGWRGEPQAGQRISAKPLGFAILKRDKDTGAYACEIFLVPAPGGRFTPTLIQTLGHEMVHCLGQEHPE